MVDWVPVIVLILISVMYALLVEGNRAATSDIRKSNGSRAWTGNLDDYVRPEKKRLMIPQTGGEPGGTVTNEPWEGHYNWRG
jgi:hypothetical protein